VRLALIAVAVAVLRKCRHSHGECRDASEENELLHVNPFRVMIGRA
jgi:hypothetical protein